MSQAQIETLRAGYEAMSRGDLDAVFREAGPDFEFVPLDQNPVGGTYRGREAVLGFFADLWAAFEKVTIEPGPFLEEGDTIVVTLRMTLLPSNSDANIEMHLTHVWTIRDGRFVRLRSFSKRDEALLAAGLSE